MTRLIINPSELEHLNVEELRRLLDQAWGTLPCMKALNVRFTVACCTGRGAEHP